MFVLGGKKKKKTLAIARQCSVVGGGNTVSGVAVSRYYNSLDFFQVQKNSWEEIVWLTKRPQNGDGVTANIEQI